MCRVARWTSGVSSCFCGSSALMAETKRRFEDATGARIVEGYSLTEGMMACCVNPVKGKNKIGSIGLPLPDVDVRIVDTEDGDRDLPSGEVGELIMRAPQHFEEHWNNREEDRGSRCGRMVPADPGILRRSRTWMMRIPFIVDRKKDMLKTSGYQVWPREIEEVLASHPAVMEVSVAGVPDPLKGEVPKAW